MFAWLAFALVFHGLAPLAVIPAAACVGVSGAAKKLLPVGYSIYIAAVALYVAALVVLGPFLAWERLTLLFIAALSFLLTVRLVTAINWRLATGAALIGALLLLPLVAAHVVFLWQWPTSVLLHLGAFTFPNAYSLRRASLHYELQAYRLLRAPQQRVSWCATRSCREQWVQLKLAMDDLRDIAMTIDGAWADLERPPTEEEVRLLRVWPDRRRLLPLVDPWGQPYEVAVRREARGQKFGGVRVASSGADRSFETETSMLGCLPQRSVIRSESLDRDLVFIPGCNFVQLFDYPADLQTFLYTDHLRFVDWSKG